MYVYDHLVTIIASATASVALVPKLDVPLGQVQGHQNEVHGMDLYELYLAFEMS